MDCDGFSGVDDVILCFCGLVWEGFNGVCVFFIVWFELDEVEDLCFGFCVCNNVNCLCVW